MLGVPGGSPVIAEEAKAAQRVGSVFAGKYRLKRVIGLGGMGAVYEAVHTFTGKPCALKLLDGSLSFTPGYAARFLREARAASDIGHPGICDVYDAGQDPADGSLYLVLELLEGESFAEPIQRGEITTDEIVEIGAQVCEAMAAAHARGIVHRDIKPENVFLTRDDRGNLRIRLLDFGIAKNVRREEDLFTTQQGLIVGTPYYMSPEQAGGDDVDHRADIWSVGAMLFHALAGKPPYEAEGYNKLIAKLITGTPPRLRQARPDLPEWLVKVVDGALVVDRTERWQSMAQMALALRVRGEEPLGLDWEGYEDATLRTESPFESRDSDPKVGLITPPGQRPGTDPSGRFPAVSPESATVALMPPESAALVAATAQQQTTGARPGLPMPMAGRSRLAFLVGVVVGAAVAAAFAVGVTLWLILS